MPKASSGSSSTGEAAHRSCSKCHGRMSSFSLDRHLFCPKCRGSECSVGSRCDECFSWTKEEMEGYVKLRKSLTSMSRKSKSSSRSSSSPPRSTAPDCDLDYRFAAQFDSVNKVMDKKLDEMSTALISKFPQMLAQFQPGSNIPSFSGDSAVPGYSVAIRSLHPFKLPSAPRAAQAFGFGRAKRIRCRMSRILFRMCLGLA